MSELAQHVPFPTRYGDFDLHWFDSGRAEMPHLALVVGLETPVVPLVRIHSECMTGDVFGSSRCDCGDQLDLAMTLIAERGAGVIVYLRQEGRGIGLVNKLRAYQLQDAGLDTVEANLALGLPAEGRDYSDAIDILVSLGVDRCELLTNNPDKIQALEDSVIGVAGVEPLEIEPTSPYCEDYLETKRRRMGHFFSQSWAGD